MRECGECGSLFEPRSETERDCRKRGRSAYCNAQCARIADRRKKKGLDNRPQVPEAPPIDMACHYRTRCGYPVEILGMSDSPADREAPLWIRVYGSPPDARGRPWSQVHRLTQDGYWAPTKIPHDYDLVPLGAG